MNTFIRNDIKQRQSAPADEHADPVNELLKQADATVYCQSALRALSSGLPADDSILMRALNSAARGREAKAFTNLYVAALYAGRRIAATVLEQGAVLLPEPMFLVLTPHRLEGDVAESLAVAVRSGRMPGECNAIAVVAGWLDYDRRGIPAPPEFLSLTRKVCWEAVSKDNPYVIRLLNLAATLSCDPTVAKILNCQVGGDSETMFELKQMRLSMVSPIWDGSIPGSVLADPVLGSEATVRRETPKAVRNGPCPCGSGRKSKRCCNGKTCAGDQYKVGVERTSNATAHRGLSLTEQQIVTMYSDELKALDPMSLTPELAGTAALRLAQFHEYSRLTEVLQAIRSEAVPKPTLDRIAQELLKVREINTLRWILDWASDSIEASFEMEILLAAPEERLQLLCGKAREASEAERSGDPSAQLLFNELGNAAIVTDSALGIVVARGVLPVSGPIGRPSLFEGIGDARRALGLDDNEPGYEIVDVTDRAAKVEARHRKEIETIRAEMSSKVTNRDAEIRWLKADIESMRKALAERDQTIERAEATSKQEAVAQAASDPAKLRDLRDENRCLKGNLKAEHEEHNRTKQELKAARDELSRANKSLGSQEPEPSADHEQDDDDTVNSVVEPGWQPTRKPEFGEDFNKSVRLYPRNTPTKAYSLANRLAKGDPVRRQLKLCVDDN